MFAEPDAHTGVGVEEDDGKLCRLGRTLIESHQPSGRGSLRVGCLLSALLVATPSPSGEWFTPPPTLHWKLPL